MSYPRRSGPRLRITTAGTMGRTALRMQVGNLSYADSHLE